MAEKGGVYISRHPEALEALEHYFGYSSFREGQAEVIDALLDGRDALAVMPTGAGKSICYQIPAALMPGLTLVVSPLISLMGDQVRALKAAGIRGSYLNSTLNPRQQELAMQRAIDGWYDVMYVAPERLAEPRFREFARQANIPLVAVDEAHCVSQWGQDFRPAYRGIADFVASLPVRPPVAALTATATRQVRSDVVDLLRLREPEVVVCGFDRPNLWFASYELTPKMRERWIVNYVRAHKDESGIIYAVTRKKVDELADALGDEGISAVAYHAGYSNDDRTAAQRRFVMDDAPVMVATNAFGMGIDKSNVRYVINSGLPLSLEEYYQEAGRAGRDGEPAECYLLWSKGDIRTCHFFIDHTEFAPELSQHERQQLLNNRERLLGSMIGYAMSTSCLRRRILSYFGQDVRGLPSNCSSCSVCTGATAQQYLREPRAHTFGAAGYSGSSRSAFDARGIYGRADSFGATSAPKAGYTNGSDGGFVPTNNPEVERGTSSVDGFGFADVPDSKHASGSYSALGPVSTFAPSTEGDEELFQRLRALRKRIATKQQVPPYIVFSDATLRSMVRLRPRTLDQMLEVSGVGAKKLQRYGQAFLDEINA